MSFQTMANREPIKTAKELAEDAEKAEQDAVYNGILDAAKKAGVELSMGFTYGWWGRDITVVLDGVDYNVSVQLERTKTGSGYNSLNNGPYRVIVGGYGERVSYPPGKNGLNFQKIVAKIVENAKGQADRSAEYVRKATVEKATENSLLKLTGSKWGNSFLRNNKGYLCVECNVTEEQAARFLALAVELGIVKQPAIEKEDSQ